MNSVGNSTDNFLASQQPSKSSFQNYSISSSSSLSTCQIPQKRKHGIFTVLEDCTNQPLQKRNSKAKADSAIHELLTTCELAPCGNPTAGVAARQQADKNADDSPATLCYIFRKSRDAFGKGAGMLLSYIQIHASYEVQKAVAIPGWKYTRNFVK